MLVTAFIAFQGNTTSTQIQVQSLSEAIPSLLKRGTLNEFSRAALKPNAEPPQFSEADIVLFIPMEGLTNMWLCQIGRAGIYASIVLTVTAEKPIEI